MTDGTIAAGLPELMLGACGVVSAAPSKTTVTVKLAVPTFPAASDAVQVTVVVPTEKLEPEDGEQVGPEVTPTSSDAVTVNVIVLPAELEVEPVRLDGTFTVGGVVSSVGIVALVVYSATGFCHGNAPHCSYKDQITLTFPPDQFSGISICQFRFVSGP